MDATYIYQPKGWVECRNQATRLRILTLLMREWTRHQGRSDAGEEATERRWRIIPVSRKKRQPRLQVEVRRKTAEQYPLLPRNLPRCKKRIASLLGTKSSPIPSTFQEPGVPPLKTEPSMSAPMTPNLRILLLQELSDSADDPSRAGGRHKHRDLSSGLLPDFMSRLTIVGLRIGQICELTRAPGPFNLRPLRRGLGRNRDRLARDGLQTNLFDEFDRYGGDRYGRRDDLVDPCRLPESGRTIRKQMAGTVVIVDSLQNCFK
jgi:hypothetical protein